MVNDPHCLLVDDDEQKRFLIAHHLQRAFDHHLTVFECGSGAEAIEHLKTHRVDAIITDHNMRPVDGLELIAWVREHYGNLPIVMVTGHPEIEPRALAAGATRVMSTSRFAEVGALIKTLIA